MKWSAMDPQTMREHHRVFGPYLYHGTNKEAADRILREGLHPHDLNAEDMYECGRCAEITPESTVSPISQQCPVCGEAYTDESFMQGSRSKWVNQFYRPRPNHVYLGIKPMAQQYLKKPGDRLLRINLSHLDPSRIHADEDAFQEAYGYEDEVPPSTQELFEHDPPPHSDFYEPGGMTLGDWAEQARLGEHPSEVRHSLFNHGTVSYEGSIPPHAISVVPEPSSVL